VSTNTRQADHSHRSDGLRNIKQDGGGRGRREPKGGGKFRGMLPRKKERKTFKKDTSPFTLHKNTGRSGHGEAGTLFPEKLPRTKGVISSNVGEKDGIRQRDEVSK